MKQLTDEEVDEALSSMMIDSSIDIVEEMIESETDEYKIIELRMRMENLLILRNKNNI
jgi:hypothetical protein